MKKTKFLLIMLLVCNGIFFGQGKKDAFDEASVFAPMVYEGLTPAESWEIHKAAFIKKLKKEGATKAEIKKRLFEYEKDKAAYFAEVKERHQMAAIEREKAAIIREEAAKRRKLTSVERDKAAVRREEAAERRKLATIEREKAAVLREKADTKRKQANDWRKDYELLITKNITLNEGNDAIEPITFTLNSETSISFGVRAHLIYGNAQLVMYNPNGKKEAELKLEYEKENSNKDGEMTYTSGSLDKIISGAKKGTWQIKIIPKNAKGSMAFSVSLKKK